LDLVQ